MLSSSRILYLAFLLLILCSACRPIVPPGPDLSDFEPMLPEAAAESLEALRLHASQLESLRAKASLLVEGRVGEQLLTEVLVFERPDKLRLEFFATNLNRLTSLLITKDGMLHAVDPINLKVYRGSADPAALGRLVSIPFAPEELMLWAGGRFNPPPAPELLSYIGYEKGKLRILQLKLQDNRSILLSYRQSESGPLLQRLELSEGSGDAVLISEYGYAETAKEIVLPEKITFWIPQESLKGTISYQQLIINPSLKADRDRLFTGRTPGNAEVIDLGSGAVRLEPLL